MLSIAILFLCTWRGAITLEARVKNSQRDENALSSTSPLDLRAETKLVLIPTLLLPSCLTPPFLYALSLSHKTVMEKCDSFSSINLWANIPMHAAGPGQQLASARYLKLQQAVKRSSHLLPGEPGLLLTLLQFSGSPWRFADLERAVLHEEMFFLMTGDALLLHCISQLPGPGAQIASSLLVGKKEKWRPAQSLFLQVNC